MLIIILWIYIFSGFLLTPLIMKYLKQEHNLNIFLTIFLLVFIALPIICLSAFIFLLWIIWMYVLPSFNKLYHIKDSILEIIILTMCESYYYLDNIFIQNILLKFMNRKIVNKNLSFSMACIRNKLKTAKFMNKNFEIKHYQSLLATCCYYNNIEVVKWLISIGYDIEHNNHYAFSLAGKKKRIEILDLLCSINSNYYYEYRYGIVKTMILDNPIKKAYYFLIIKNDLQGTLKALNISKYKKSEAYRCAFCYDNHIEGIELECFHKFCIESILKYYVINDLELTCFMCRKVINFENCTYLIKN